MRTARAMPLCLSDRGTHGLLQLHRRLLQSHPAALRPGVSLAHLLRTGDANTPTVRHPLNRPPKRGNFKCDCSSLKTRVRWRTPSPRMRATASVVLSYRIEPGTLPKKLNAALCPSQNASVVSAG